MEEHLKKQIKFIDKNDRVCEILIEEWGIEGNSGKQLWHNNIFNILLLNKTLAMKSF